MAQFNLPQPFEYLCKFMKHFKIDDSYDEYFKIVLKPNDELSDEEAEHLVETIQDALETLINISKGESCGS